MNNEVIDTDTSTEALTDNKAKSITETRGKLGTRKGNMYIFSKKVKSINGSGNVIPNLVYKKIKEDTDSEGKKVVVLKLNGQDQKIEFYKEDLYNGFGIKIKSKKGGKSHSIWCNDEEYKIISNVLKKIIAEKKYYEILKGNSIDKIKSALDSLDKTK